MTMRLRRAVALAVTAALLALIAVVWRAASGEPSGRRELDCRATSQQWPGDVGSATVEVRDGMPVSGFHDLNGAWYDLWARTTAPLLPTTRDGTYDAVVREAPPSK